MVAETCACFDYALAVYITFISSEISPPADLQLRLANRAENVVLVRHALGGLAAAVHLSDERLSDVRTAVSEACNNVVLHAYGGDEGPLSVSAQPEDESLVVVVRDSGDGIQPRSEPETGEMQGVGLSLIQTLTDRVEFSGGDEGTEVRMTFATEQPLDTGTAPANEPMQLDVALLHSDAVVSTCGHLVGPVLSSVIGMLAARADFTVQRLADAQLVTDAIAAHGPASFPGRYVNVAVDTSPQRLELRLGPLREGGAGTLMHASSVDGIGPLLARLTDEHAVEPGEHEILRLTLLDSR